MTEVLVNAVELNLKMRQFRPLDPVPLCDKDQTIKRSDPLPDEPDMRDLVQKLFEIPEVTGVRFTPEFITVGLQSPEAWKQKLDSVHALVAAWINSRMPRPRGQLKRMLDESPSIRNSIEIILDRVVRPHLGRHNGAVRVESLENNLLVLELAATCTSCSPNLVEATQDDITGVFSKLLPDLQVEFTPPATAPETGLAPSAIIPTLSVMPARTGQERTGLATGPDTPGNNLATWGETIRRDYNASSLDVDLNRGILAWEFPREDPVTHQHFSRRISYSQPENQVSTGGNNLGLEDVALIIRMALDRGGGVLVVTDGYTEQDRARLVAGGAEQGVKVLDAAGNPLRAGPANDPAPEEAGGSRPRRHYGHPATLPVPAAA